VRRILLGAAGTMILAAVVTAGAIAISAPKQETFNGGWGHRAVSTSASSGASQEQAAPSNAGDFESTLHVILRQAHVLFLETNPHGARGDQLVVEGPVLKPGTDDTIGLFDARCQLVAPQRNSLFDCNATVNLYGNFPHGASITAQGGSSNATSWTNAVTGGTRRFADVTGQVRLHNIAGSNDIDAWFYLNHVH
jgi:hypothetical protein